MTVALWIIAACEIIRALQNALQLFMVRHDSSQRDNAYAEFIKSLKSTDSEFVRKLLEEYEKYDPAEPENDEDDMRSEIE